MSMERMLTYVLFLQHSWFYMHEEWEQRLAVLRGRSGNALCAILMSLETIFLFMRKYWIILSNSMSYSVSSWSVGSILGVWKQYGRPQILLEISSQNGRDIEGLNKSWMGEPGIERCLGSRISRMWGQIGCGSQRKRVIKDNFNVLPGWRLLYSRKVEDAGRCGFRDVGELLSLYELLRCPNTSTMHVYL